MGWIKRFIKKRKSREIRKLPKFLRGQARFRSIYPEYSIGVGSYGVPLVHDWQEGSTLKIGSYCSIAEGVQIFLGGLHRSDWISTYPFPAMVPEAAHIKGYNGTKGDVVIGSDVWICSNSTILSGVTIGDGAIIAAGAMVVKNVEPYAVVAGNPARLIRWRFNEDTRRALLEAAWWEWPEEEVKGISSKLCSNDIEGFLEYLKFREKHACI
jgi:acetyltransferase-like isoleucine patch superfamily enzyme